jgi:hypothetical protein
LLYKEKDGHCYAFFHFQDYFTSSNFLLIVILCNMLKINKMYPKSVVAYIVLYAFFPLLTVPVISYIKNYILRYWGKDNNKRYTRFIENFFTISEECCNCAYSSVCIGSYKAGNDKIYKKYCHMDLRCMEPRSKSVGQRKLLIEFHLSFN